MTLEMIILGLLLVANLAYVHFVVRAISEVEEDNAMIVSRLAKVNRDYLAIRRELRDLTTQLKRLASKEPKAVEESFEADALKRLRQIMAENESAMAVGDALKGSRERKADGKWKVRTDGTFEMKNE